MYISWQSTISRCNWLRMGLQVNPHDKNFSPASTYEKKFRIRGLIPILANVCDGMQPRVLGQHTANDSRPYVHNEKVPLHTSTYQLIIGAARIVQWWSSAVRRGLTRNIAGLSRGSSTIVIMTGAAGVKDIYIGLLRGTEAWQ